MKLVLTAALLILVAGCGSSSSDHPKLNANGIVEDSSSAPVVDAGLQATCAKLGRTWAVAAEKVVSALYIGLQESVDAATSKMSDATDQMDIEGCKGDVVADALRGNYEASVASAKLLTCKGDVYVCGEKAGNYWKKHGFPPLVRVRALVG